MIVPKLEILIKCTHKSTYKIFNDLDNDFHDENLLYILVSQY